MSSKPAKTKEAFIALRVDSSMFLDSTSHELSAAKTHLKYCRGRDPTFGTTPTIGL